MQGSNRTYNGIEVKTTQIIPTTPFNPSPLSITNAMENPILIDIN